MEGWNNLGKAYLELRQWREAERALLRGIEVNDVSPSDSVKMCWNNVGLVYIQTAHLGSIFVCVSEDVPKLVGDVRCRRNRSFL